MSQRKEVDEVQQGLLDGQLDVVVVVAEMMQQHRPLSSRFVMRDDGQGLCRCSRSLDLAWMEGGGRRMDWRKTVSGSDEWMRAKKATNAFYQCAMMLKDLRDAMC